MSREAEEARLKEELTNCVLGSSYLYSSVGVGLAIPLSLRVKSITPLVYLTAAGTGADLLTGYSVCRPQRQALNACREAWAAQADVIKLEELQLTEDLLRFERLPGPANTKGVFEAIAASGPNRPSPEPPGGRGSASGPGGGARGPASGEVDEAAASGGETGTAERTEGSGTGGAAPPAEHLGAVGGAVPPEGRPGAAGGGAVDGAAEAGTGRPTPDPDAGT